MLCSIYGLIVCLSKMIFNIEYIFRTTGILFHFLGGEPYIDYCLDRGLFQDTLFPDTIAQVLKINLGFNFLVWFDDNIYLVE